MDIEAHLRSEMVKAMVQKQIFCPITGRVLDVRTVKYFVDGEGDPAYVVDPVAYSMIIASPEALEVIKGKGWTP